MGWFLYDNGLRHERVNNENFIAELIILMFLRNII